MAKKVLLYEVKLDQASAEQRANEFANAIARDREELKLLNKQIRENGASDKQQIADKNRLTNQIKNNTKELRLNNNILNSQSNSLGALRQQEKLLRSELDKVDQSTKKGKDSAKELTDQILELKTTINTADEATGDFRGNVGNYANAIREAIPGTFDLGEGMVGLSSASRIGAASFQLVNKSIGGTNKVLRIFKLVLASTGIGLILVALASLITFLTSTQEGMAKVNKVTRVASAIFNRLIGVLQVLGGKVFNGLVKAISSPREALGDLVDFIQDQVLSRFKSIGIAAQGVALILSGNLSLGFETLKKAGTQAMNDIEQAVDDVKGAIEGTTQLINETIDTGLLIDRLNREIGRGEVNLIERRGELLRISKEQNKVAEDVRESEAVRAKAAREAIGAQIELENLEIEQFDRKIALMQAENSLNDTLLEDEKELAELNAERSAAITRSLEARTTLQNKLNIIEQQAAAKRKAEAIAALNDQIAALEVIRGSTSGQDKESLKIDQEIAALRTDILLKNEQLTANQRLLINAELIEKQTSLEAKFLENIKKLREDAIKARLAEGGEFFDRQALERELQFLQASSELDQFDKIGRLEAERDFQSDIADIRAERLRFEIGQLDDDNLLKLQKEADLQNLLLEQEQDFADRSLEIETRKIDAERDLQDARIAFYRSSSDFLVENINQQTIAGKAALVLSKASATAEIAINLQRELSAIRAANAIFPEPAGSIVKGIQSGFAIARAIKSTADIVGIKFDKGGIAIGPGNIPAGGGMITGPSHANGGVKFAMGNKIGEADGKKGEAYIINTAKRPELRALASRINVAGGGRAFAPSIPNRKFQSGGVVGDIASEFTINNEANQSLIQALSELPPPLVDLQEFAEKTNRIAKIEQNAIIE